MTCPVCKGEGWVVIECHDGYHRFANCPRCREWGTLKRLWERVKGVFGA